MTESKWPSRSGAFRLAGSSSPSAASSTASSASSASVAEHAVPYVLTGSTTAHVYIATHDTKPPPGQYIDVVKDNFLMQQFAKQHGTPLRGGDSATKKRKDLAEETQPTVLAKAHSEPAASSADNGSNKRLNRTSSASSSTSSKGGDDYYS